MLVRRGGGFSPQTVDENPKMAGTVQSYMTLPRKGSLIGN